jgi:alpha-amylase/alpha-mannosidase (GH57 family)
MKAFLEPGALMTRMNPKQGDAQQVERYICIHAHFYQPPRENPWLEAIEIQDSAYPYHDWNERITAECYATNATSRILDEQGKIARIVNNYSKISFNVGPTLLAWMEENAPDVYGAILDADKESQSTFSGHGSALAQAYNHVILPLANRRDKITQVLWGIRDFEHRFGRTPEGMWLPETAVDLETLDILSDHGIRFTILAPRQAKQVRPEGSDTWQDVSGERIDPTMAYAHPLPSGRTITLFFYDGPVSRAVAFEGLLSQGDVFAKRLLEAFSEERSWPQIVHIATDGESYGHHHANGDMALAYALDDVASNNLARLTNYGEYLEKHPPTHEVQIFENSSWSCIHGIERWQSDCGCNSGGRPGWNQGWRRPLRDALDWLRETLAPAYEKRARSFFNDPWKARDQYVQVMLDRSLESVDDYFVHNASGKLEAEEKVTALKLLEIQRHTLLMYTSCGWFFDELSGIETVQVLQYAGRALQLAQELFGNTVEPRFLELLVQAKSNLPEHGDGKRIYEKFVKPAAVDLTKVGAHYAMSSLFEDYGEQVGISCFSVDQEAFERMEAGKTKLALGRVKLTSEITRESLRVCFGVMHWGDHNLSGCVKPCGPEEPDEAVMKETQDIFAKADFPGTLQTLEKHFGPSLYSLMNLFRDEQRKILNLILESTMLDVEGIYHQVYESNAPLLRFLKDIQIPPPRALYTAAEHVLNTSLRNAFEAEELDFQSIENFLSFAELEGIALDSATLEMAVRKKMEHLAKALEEVPGEIPIMKELDMAADLLRSLPFQVNLRKVQNIYYTLLLEAYPGFQTRGDEASREWVASFKALGEKLWLKVE